MARYVALLRGINVGGNNIVKMSELKACFEHIGYQNVHTYINSGNIIFESSETNSQKLTNTIETALKEAFGFELRVVVCSLEQLRAIVQNAPKGFGARPTEYRYDFIFLKPPLTVGEAMTVISPKEGVDEITQGESVLYSSRLIARVVQSRLNKIVGTKPYQNMTIRNWNTTVRLLALLEAL